MSTISSKTFSGSFSRYWNDFFLMHFFGQNMFKKLISIHQLCPQSVLKHSVDHSQGIGMKIYFFLKNAFFCQNMFKKVVSIHQFMSTISSKTFSGSFSRYWNEFFFIFSFFKIEICASMCNILQFRNGKIF